jgi:Amt family ammonium transporter
MVAALAVNALLASAAGALWAFAHTRLRFGKPDLSMICNGLLAGLVAISAAGGFVGGGSAIVIGAGASLLTLEGALFIERRLRIDDPVGAGAVHGISGAWGLLAVGIFANGRAGDGWNGFAGPVRGLLAGSGGQLLASVIGIAANVLWVVPSSAVVLWIIGRLVSGRVVADDEVAGLDVPELGMTGYVSEAVHAGATRGGDLGHGKMSASRTSVTG